MTVDFNSQTCEPHVDEWTTQMLEDRVAYVLENGRFRYKRDHIKVPLAAIHQNRLDLLKKLPLTQDWPFAECASRLCRVDCFIYLVDECGFPYHHNAWPSRNHPDAIKMAEILLSRGLMKSYRAISMAKYKNNVSLTEWYQANGFPSWT